MKVADLAHAIAAVDADLPRIRDALNAADRRLGDGDTGMTIEQVVTAWRTVELSDASDVGVALVALGAATGRATGSSLGSVVAIGLRAAGRAVQGSPSLDCAGVVNALRAARDAITTRSGAAPGDKTMLDSIVSIEQALTAAEGDCDVPAVALSSCDAALEAFRTRETRLGRGRLYGEKSIGFDDPGMLAMSMLLRAASTGRG